MIKVDFTMYIYASDAMVGTVGYNELARVPLALFPSGSLQSGKPKEPEWLAIQVAALNPMDKGEKTLERRAGGAYVRRGDRRWGGVVTMPAFNYANAADRAQYFALIRALGKQYVYLYMGDYPEADEIFDIPGMPDAQDYALRITPEVGDVEGDGRWKTLPVTWYKYSVTGDYD